MTAFSLRVVAGRRKFEITEREVFNDERILELRMDGEYLGEIGLVEYYTPGIAVGSSQLMVWGGRDVYLIPFTGGEFSYIEMNWEVHAAYEVRELWLCVCELSLVLLDASGQHEVARYDHDEILLEQAWHRDRLIVRDFYGNRLTFKPESWQLKPLSVEEEAG